MTDHVPAKSRQPIKIERTYEADVEDVWALWTTKEGFEAWWGPEGFRVEVRALDLRVGGTLSYDMIADGAEQIAWMKRDMVVTIEAHREDEWTERSIAGFTSQLTKVPAALAARRKSR